MQNLQQKNTLFVLIGGLILTVFVLAVTFILSYLGVTHFVISNGIVYLFEFGFFCLALYFYRIWVTNVVWFSQGAFILILITLFKIILTVLILYVIFSLGGFFVENSAWNFIALFGPFVRGFIFELAAIGIAAKLFETDIFQKNKPKSHEHIIDDL